MRVLSHFSENEFQFDASKKYIQSNGKLEVRDYHKKPRGLWLSDETDVGWKQWCEEVEFHLEKLKYQTEFEVAEQKLLILDSDSKILAFTEQYDSGENFGFDFIKSPINWAQVAKSYKGILISPYSYELRLSFACNWYYAWDCASACVWDLSCLKPI